MNRDNNLHNSAFKAYNDVKEEGNLEVDNIILSMTNNGEDLKQVKNIKYFHLSLLLI